jgi:hypothetical protein
LIVNIFYFIWLISLLIFLDSHDLLFEQENNIEFVTKNTAQPTTPEPNRRPVSAIFGDTKSNDRYYEPQKITDDTLMDVCIHFNHYKFTFLYHNLEWTSRYTWQTSIYSSISWIYFKFS